MKKTDYIVYILLFICLTAVLMPRPTAPLHDNNQVDMTEYTNTIKKLDSVVLMRNIKVNYYIKLVDSLKKLPVIIKIKYKNEKSKIPTASVVELDSIIRANAGLPQR